MERSRRLERAYAQRAPGLCSLKVDWLFRNVHADPRWDAFLRKMGLRGLTVASQRGD